MITEGILNIYKPQGMTSHDVVSAVRKTLGIRKAGHTGTLDPMACGVLPVCIGKSTRIMEYLDADIKEYRCLMILGTETDTDDIWGKVISKKGAEGLSRLDIEKAFGPFSGLIGQKPPIYSALKVKGKKLYEYAREGRHAEIKEREVYITSLSIDHISLDGEEKTAAFTVGCTKGTYIRAICRDVGAALGCGAALSGLERTASGAFKREDSVALDKLADMTEEEIKAVLSRTDFPLGKFGAVETGEVGSMKFVNGSPLSHGEYRILRRPFYEERDFFLPLPCGYKKAYNVYGSVAGEKRFLGVAFYNDRDKKLAPGKIFCQR